MGDQVEAIYRQSHVKEPAVTGRADAMIDFLLAGTVNQNMARLFSLNRPLLPSVYPGHELMTGVHAGRQVGVCTDIEGSVVAGSGGCPANGTPATERSQRRGRPGQALSEHGDPPCANRWTDAGHPAARRRAIGSSGGMPEPAETPADGVAREVLDEADIKAQAPRLTGVHKNMRLGVVTLGFRCSILDGRDQEDVIDEARKVLQKPPAPTVMPAMA